MIEVRGFVAIRGGRHVQSHGVDRRPGTGKTITTQELSRPWKVGLACCWRRHRGMAAKLYERGTWHGGQDHPSAVEVQPLQDGYKAQRREPAGRRRALIVDEHHDRHPFDEQSAESCSCGMRLVFVGDIDQLPSVTGWKRPRTSSTRSVSPSCGLCASSGRRRRAVS